jgi:hypothetical protein
MIPKNPFGKIRRWRGWRPLLLTAGLLALPTLRASAQTSTRLLLASGNGVPDHPGFVFGQFSALAMNARKQVAFLTALLSARTQSPAIVRSSGVTFSVVAFQGLVTPVPGTLFDSFGAPSINDSGAIAFSAALRSTVGGTPTTGIFGVAGGQPKVIATTGSSAGGTSAAFQDFSSPVIGSSGAILFGALTAGNPGASGLYLWTPQGVQSVPLPAGFTLGPAEMLQPIFQSEDESVWAPDDASVTSADDQLFRALAIRSFQEMNPPPNPSSTVQALPPATGEKPVQLLLVILNGTKPDTMALQGDPTQPVTAVLGAGAPPELPLSQLESGVTSAFGGSVVIASSSAAHPGDLAFYCFCNGEVDRLTTPGDFTQVAILPTGRTILSLTSDGQHTVGFIAPTPGQPSSNAIFITSIE